MLHNVPPHDLHAMGYGKHMEVMDEWNEENDFDWQPALIHIQGPFTQVIQEEKPNGALMIAVYRTHGESDLVSLRVYGMDSFHVRGHDYLAAGEEGRLNR